MEKRLKIIIGVVIAFAFIGGIIWAFFFKGISAAEKKQIDEWIKENNLNEYGDPKETMYLGGTPLFDETTGKTIDRYQYILENHSDRPWRKK